MGFLPKQNPVFTGDAKAVTVASTDNDTSIATTAMVQSAITANVPTIVSCLAYRSAALNHSSSGNYVVIGLDAEEDDTSTMHDNSTNNSRIVAPTAGLYMVTMSLRLAASATGIIGVDIRKNAAGSAAGGTRLAVTNTDNDSGAAPFVTLSRVVRLAASDYVEMFGFQNSGGTLAYTVGADQTWLSLTRIGS